jgi:predicted GNAT family acetyltransferase
MVTQTGNLLYLFQSHDDITPEIYDLWSKSNITGILGEYPICEQIHENLKWDKTTFGQPKEVLMRLDLPKHAVTRVDIGDTRFLVDDFDQYWILSGDFCKEMGLKLEEKEFGRSQFVLGCSNRIHFGTFVDGSLVSIARLNSHAKTSGIIGRVFTDQKHRGKGYSYRTISLLIQETSRELKKLLLFTDPKGGALNLYRRLGFIEIGHVGMFVK